MAFKLNTDFNNPLLDEDDDETYTPPTQHFNPVLDEDDEETVAPQAPSPVVAVEEPPASPRTSTTDSTEEEAARLAERKAKRAAKRAANHAEHPVWYRRRAGREGKDLDYLNFLARFKYAKAAQLAALHGVSKHTAYKRLKGLEEYGYVWEFRLHDQSSIWLPTYKGVSTSQFAHLDPPSRALSTTLLTHNLIVNHVAANWAGGVFDVLDLGSDFLSLDAPKGKGKDETDLRKRRSLSLRMVTEPQIKAALKPHFDRYDSKAANEALRDSFFRARNDDTWKWSSSATHLPELWALFARHKTQYDDYTTASYPDLVLVDPRKPHKRYMVEVETSQKRSDRLREKLHAYRFNSHFDLAIYVVPDPSTRKLITRLAKEAGVSERLKVIPLYVQDKDGKRIAHNGTDWRF